MIVIKLLFVEIIHYLCKRLRETFNRTVLELKKKINFRWQSILRNCGLKRSQRANFYYRRFET